MVITHKRAPGRPSFVTKSFVHPKTGKTAAFSLGRDEEIAQAVCRDLSVIVNDESLWHGTDKRLHAFEPRAIEIFFGAESEAAKKAAKIRAIVSDGELRELRARARAAESITGSTEPENAVIAASIEQAFIELKNRIQRLETENANLRAETEHLRADISRLRRQSNAHVKATVADAIAAWVAEYPSGRNVRTVGDAIRSVEMFGKSVEGTMLAEVRGGHIDAWLAALKAEKLDADGTERELSPITKKKMRAYVSGFWNWAYRRYDLSENPVEKSSGVAGVARAPEHILAIRRLADLTALFDGLANYPYWCALIKTAILAGPRFSELCYLKIDDVYLEDNYLRITSRTSGPRIVGTKTGRERSVPIEQTVLLPSLSEHVGRRQFERKKKSGTVAEQSQWVFPSTVPVGTVERSKTPAGLWSDNATFSRTWHTIAAAASKKAKSDADYWSFGPSEWRHSFGTCLAQCGFSSLEVARMMGNSSQIAERFYCGNLSRDAGKRWPFKW